MTVISKTSLAAAALALLVPLTAQAETDVRFAAVIGLSHGSIGLAAAIDSGALEKAGIKAEVTDFKGGGPAVQSLVGGAVDVCVCAPEHVVRLRNKGINAVNLAPLSNRLTYALIGAQGSTEVGLASLKGEKIGVTSAGSKTDTLIRLALQREGIDPESDVQLIAVGGTAPQLTALATGNIKAGFINGLDAISAEANGHPIVYDWRDVAVPDLALIVTEEWISANPDTARILARETVAAANAVHGDSVARAALLRKLYPQATDAVIATATERLNADVVLTPTFSEASFEALLMDLVEVDPSLKPIPFAEFSRDFTQ